MKCMIKERKKDHTIGKNQGLDWKSSEEGEGVEGKVFGREMREFLSREIWEKWKKKKNCTEAIYRKTHLDGSRSCQELSSTNSRQINLSSCCREFVDGKRTSVNQTAIEKLLSRQKLSWWIENLSRSYRQIQESFDGWKCDKIFLEKQSKGLDR